MPYLRDLVVAEPLEHDFDDNIQDSVVLDLLPDISELELLVREIEQQQQDQQNGVKLPTMCAMPISERVVFFVMSGAFPILFPMGRADFNLPRSRLVNFAAFAKYMFKYKDGWFGRYSRF